MATLAFANFELSVGRFANMAQWPLRILSSVVATLLIVSITILRILSSVMDLATRLTGHFANIGLSVGNLANMLSVLFLFLSSVVAN